MFDKNLVIRFLENKEILNSQVQTHLLMDVLQNSC